MRFSLDTADILIERKTFRGRVGALLKGADYPTMDAGYRREWGHVPVATIAPVYFNLPSLAATLQETDSWRGDRPHWVDVEARESRTVAEKKRQRQELVRYRTEELWNRYVTQYKQRVYVPAKIG